MKIGISAEFIGMQAGGTETYILNLLKGLMALDRENDYDIYVVREEVLKLLNIPENYHISPTWIYNSWLRTLMIMPCKLMRQPVDILHVQNVVPPFYRGKSVVSIHDISFEIFPKTFPKAIQYRLSIMVRRAARKADMIITGSQNTKKDLMKYYGISPGKIEVTPYCHDRIYRVIEDREAVEKIRQKYGIDAQFILCVGALQPRKNLVRLIQAWCHLIDHHGLKQKLVIVGKEAWVYKEIIQTIKAVKHADDIIYTGYVPDEELPYIYNAAELFVFPSLYEGFGLVVLEAMACGVPVIASNNSSLPEVVGEAGILVDPYKYEEIAEAMYRVLSDPQLQMEMSKKSIKQSAAFSYKHTAERTLQVYLKTFNKS